MQTAGKITADAVVGEPISVVSRDTYWSPLPDWQRISGARENRASAAEVNARVDHRVGVGADIDMAR